MSFTDQTELFTVERSDGEWICNADACDYSVFASLSEAQDCLDNEADSGDPSDTYKIIRFVRASELIGNLDVVMAYLEEDAPKTAYSIVKIIKNRLESNMTV